LGPLLFTNPAYWDMSPWAIPAFLLTLLPVAWPFIVSFGILGPESSNSAGRGLLCL
jgi:hypothetical protein